MRSATPIKIVFIGRIIEKTHVKKFSTLKSVIFFPARFFQIELYISSIASVNHSGDRMAEAKSKAFKVTTD
jgi:hypothetical protein